jgi:bifunctional non-homologous end joining protein LigD
MLAHLAEPFNSKEFLFEVKFDGTRTIAYIDTQKHSVQFLNRRGIYFEDRYPEFKDSWKQIKAKRVVLDGELVVFKEGKPDFYSLQTREHVDEKMRIELLSRMMPATLIVFDILHKDGKDLIDFPLMERKKILQEVVEENERILISTYIIGKGKKFFEEVRKKGLEGVMAKKLESTYQLGKRSKDWLKIKYLKTLDCIICGFTKGTGWREEYFGALLCGTYFKRKLIYLGRVGTGWSESDLKYLTPSLKKLETKENPFDTFEEEPSIIEKIHWVKPKLVAEIKFMNLSEDLKMRAPSFQRLREDKKPEECILNEEDLKILKT